MSAVATTCMIQAVTDAVLAKETKRLYDHFNKVEAVQPSAYVVVPTADNPDAYYVFHYWVNGEVLREGIAPPRITDPQEAMKVLHKTVDLALADFADARDILYVRRPLRVEVDYSYESGETTYVVSLRCVGVKL